MAALWAGNMLISSSTQFQYLKTTPQSDLVQNKLISTSLGTDWIKNERFELLFAKTIIFMLKTRSINSGTAADQLKIFFKHISALRFF
jgi:hypothetical protein